MNIEHTDRIPPTLIHNKGLRIVEGGKGFLTRDVLQLTDIDSPVKNLTYIITQYPQHGHLYVKDLAIHWGQFTQLDVDDTKVYYRHNGGPGQIDKFSFIATDKVNHGVLVNGELRDDPIEFTIEVEYNDRMSPKLLIKTNPTTIQNLKDGRATIPITVRNLKVVDDESRDEEVIFRIQRQPLFGYLENLKEGGFLKNYFTQDDLNQDNLRYIINSSSEVTSDSFEFDVSDAAGNTIVPEILEIRWSRIELAETCYHICENVGSLPIKILRTGESAEPSFVGIKVEEGSARSGLDFTHSTARLVQFDPGVSSKIWHILLQDDGLEENDEVFKIILNKPKNAILGHKREVMVKILDPRAGHCESPAIFHAGDTLEALQGPKKASKSLLPAGYAFRPNRKGRTHHETWHLHNKNPCQPHYLSSPKGDVPQTERLLNPIAMMDFPAHSDAQLKEKPQDAEHHPLTHQGIIPPGPEDLFVLPSVIAAAAKQPLSGLPFHLRSKHNLPQRDLAVWSELIPSQRSTKQRAKSRRCPSSWTIHDKYCYLLSSAHSATWESAERGCRKWSSGHLASVHSRNEMAWLWEFAGKQPFWIGLKEEWKMGSWVWTNGRPVTFHNFKEGKAEPRRTNEQKCVFVKNQDEWVVRPCRRRLKGRYICSTPLLASTFPKP